VVKIYISML